MRTRGRIDGNQNSIVRDLRDAGLSVAITSALGNGFPDIAVGFRGRNWLFEIKDPSKVPSARKLTSAEATFAGLWRGQVHTIETSEQVLAIVGLK